MELDSVKLDNASCRFLYPTARYRPLKSPKLKCDPSRLVSSELNPFINTDPRTSSEAISAERLDSVAISARLHCQMIVACRTDLVGLGSCHLDFTSIFAVCVRRFVARLSVDRLATGLT